MQAYIVVATKGRAKEVSRLLDILQQQSLLATFTFIVGSESNDLGGLADHPLIAAGHGQALISPKVGATSQRNFGILAVINHHKLFQQDRYFCVFFDDDFRPDKDWLFQASQRFIGGNIVGLTGHVLADGINACGLEEEQARDFLDGKAPPQSHWASGSEERAIKSAYGCNMAFSDVIIESNRFDENLPLYGWQEDRDYTGMAIKKGRVIYFPGCRGVHLGAQKGRTSGVKFGYSQIANPLYLMKKGTMDFKAGVIHILRNFTANIVRSITNNRPHVDYWGRLKGNFIAIRDVLRFRLDPRNIIKMN